jgi:hypothetical protein
MNIDLRIKPSSLKRGVDMVWEKRDRLIVWAVFHEGIQGVQ